jgi:hypothetical protein
MRISRNCVKIFLIVFLIIIFANIVSILFDSWSYWIGITLALFVLFFLFLVLRKMRSYGFKLFSWGILLIIIIVSLYLYFLPFGYNNTYFINVSSDGSFLTSGIYLEDSNGKIISDLSEIYSLGTFYAVIKQRGFVRNIDVSIAVDGNDVYLAKYNFEPNWQDWDYSWDFSLEIPENLSGNANYDEARSCVHFNGSSDRLYYSNSISYNKSFIVFVEWFGDDNRSNQNIIGNYNWEILQGSDYVRFMVRIDGEVMKIDYNINNSFFNKSHYAIGVYNQDSEGRGYIEFWVNGEFAGRKNIFDSVIDEFEGDLYFGSTSSYYGNNDYFRGCIYFADIAFDKMRYQTGHSFSTGKNSVRIPMMGTGNLDSIVVKVQAE